VLGVISPVDPKAPNITFQINLPASWNGKALQFGGGGFNGTLVTGLGRVAGAPPDVEAPLAQGFVTFGTDSGHQNASLPEEQAFALNEEALVNFAHAAYKKTRDVAMDVIERYYERRPSRLYFAGLSEGGREALTVAQRFPADYDGVISVVPVIAHTGLLHADHRSGMVQQDGGWMNPAAVALLHEAVLGACDMLDGLADGIVSNYEGCNAAFRVETLRCREGQSGGNDCLSDKQIAAVKAVHSPYEFPFPLANGIRTYPGVGYGGENQPGGFQSGIAGSQAPTASARTGSGQATQWTFANAYVRYFMARDANADPMTYNPAAHAARVREISELLDSTNPDLSAFHRRGGKIILKEHSADYIQSPFAGIEYYKSVVARMGQPTVDQFMRLYVAPGLNHGGTGVSGTTGKPIPHYVDLLGVLDRWVDQGQAPPDPLIETEQAAAPPFATTASRPLCRYPNFPKYTGAGDPAAASSFTCAAR
jgi:feruloyl esterase